MEPYYKSWQHSSHKDVSCIECHFPPGIGGKLRGKMLGLVQLAKYVTDTASPRPAAEISDASCLRSGCHETRLLMGRVEFHGIAFDHAPHLEEPQRGKKLRCTSCHSQIVQGQHMTVTLSTCFLCHFKGQKFNEGLGACTHCHQIPDKAFDLGGGVMFNHDLAYERGVDCSQCHGDLIRGTGEVPRDRCGFCHDREDHLKKIDDHVFIHDTHVTNHSVTCMACHMEIQHSKDRDKVAHAAADCASCHPNHHGEQVKMLQGTGGKSIADRAGVKESARLECRACHQSKEVSSTGSVLWKASLQVCANCHDASSAQRLEAYHKSLRSSLRAIDKAFERVSAALQEADLPPDQAIAAAAKFEQLRHDLTFLRVANGVHNVHYASKLTAALVAQISSLSRELKLPEPQIVLPERKAWEGGTNGKQHVPVSTGGGPPDSSRTR
jgi:hypothetical protein